MGVAQKETGMKKLITCLVVCVLSGVVVADTWAVNDDDKADFAEKLLVNQDLCGTTLSPEVLEQIQRMLDDGSWHEATHTDPLLMRGTIYVKTIFHILRYIDGSGGMDVSYCQQQINNLNAHIAGTGVEFCIQDIMFHDLQDPTVTYPAGPTVGFDPNSMNVYCTPEIIPGYCGYASYPSGTTFVIQNSCMEPSSKTFSHEAGHYFFLPHTFSGTENGSNPECVDGSNCSSAGDYICDTAADDNGGFASNCNYIGGGTDNCNGDTYAPNEDNIMSYSYNWCRIEFTPNQLSLFLYTAQTYRTNITSDDPCVNTGACCSETGTCIESYEYQCENVGWNWQGLGTVCEDGCLQNALGACCIGTSICLDILESTCNAGGGTWQGPATSCANGDCDKNNCPADINGDSVVNVTDLLMVVAQWELTDAPADINQDGIVDVSDLLIVVGTWGPCE